VVCEFVKVTPVAPVALVYGFGGFFFLFLIELGFFIVYFFSHILKKIVFEKNQVMKLYKVTQININ